MTVHKVLACARQELGEVEDPAGSNLVKYASAYGLNGYPWCVMFLWWVFRAAGASPLFFGGAKTASCGVLLRWYRENGYTADKPQPGDIVILNFSGTQDTEHCGLVVRAMSDGSVETIEGNTTPGLEGSQSNGGSVARKVRLPGQIVGICRPRYMPDEQAPDYAGHWAEAAIRRCIEAGLMTGDPDGSFRPNEKASRAEIATVLSRLLDKMEGST